MNVSFKDLENYDKALYNTVDAIVYNSIDYEMVGSKSYGFFTKNSGSIKIGLREEEEGVLSVLVMSIFDEKSHYPMNPLHTANYINFVKQVCLYRYKFSMSDDSYIGPFAVKKKLFNKSYKKKVEIDIEVKELLKTTKKSNPKVLFELYKTIYEKYKAL